MKNVKQTLPLLILIFMLVLAAACTPAAGSGGASDNTADTADTSGVNDEALDEAGAAEVETDAGIETETETDRETEVEPEAGTEMTMYVAATTVPCEGVAPQTCLQVRFDPDAEWTLFYDNIAGFDYQPGFAYELRVNQTTVANPPADSSALRYELIEIVSQEAVPAAPAELLDQTWQWLRFEGGDEAFNFDVENPAAYTLTFQPDGTYFLQADCNSGSGAYTVSGSSIQLLSGPMTLAECGPESRYDFFTGRLLEVVTFIIADDHLYLNLMMDGGNLVLAPAPVDALANTEWTLTNVISGTNLLAVDTELGLSARFEDGVVGGFAGCNNYSGSYEATDGSLTLGPIASTRMFCEGEGGTLENVFFAALSQVTGYKLDENGLALLAADGTVVLLFTPAAS